MAITAPVTGLSLAALARWAAALPPPDAGLAAATDAPVLDAVVLDAVVFSSAPLRLLSDLAAAGLRQLVALLPIIERAVSEESALPLGHLAKAIGAAARQIGDGHAALLAEGPGRVATALPRESEMAALRAVARQLGAAPRDTSPGDGTAANDDRQPLREVARQLGQASDGETPRQDPPAEADSAGGAAGRWLGQAQHALQGASGLLDRAEDRLRPLLPGPADAPADPADQQSSVAATSIWAMTEVLAAQAQVAIAYAGIAAAQLRSAPRAAATAGSAGSVRFIQLTGAATLFGTGLVLAIAWLLGGLWSTAVALAGAISGVALAALWGWRVVVSARGVKLDLRR